jgi:UDP-N-acetylmuramate: L-alanyl-gamma-D-glutamyl-meso-diaminopimelate ligase
VLAMGLWSELERTSINGSGNWQAQLLAADGSAFTVSLAGEQQGQVRWSHTGRHNVLNALSAIAAARHVGVKPAMACEALSRFQGVKRRMECLGEIGGVKIYDDFAHHPTAIATTLEGLRAQVGGAPITAIIEPRSNTMRMGAHLAKLAVATAQADRVLWYQPAGLDWSLQSVVEASDGRAQLMRSTDAIIDAVLSGRRVGEHIVIMSNGGFEGIHQRLVTALQSV